MERAGKQNQINLLFALFVFCVRENIDRRAKSTIQNIVLAKTSQP